MKQISLAIAALGFVASAHAAPLRTQYFFQADADKNVAQAAFGYGNSSFKDPVGNKTEEAGSLRLNLNYERGVNDKMAVGILVPWLISGKIKVTGQPDRDHNGVGDIVIYAKGTAALNDNQNFQYGLGLSYSLTDPTTNSTRVDAQDGRISFIPYIGYVASVSGNLNLGAKLSYNVAVNTPKVKNDMGTFDHKGKDVTTFSVFGEVPFMTGVAGLEIAYRAVNSTKNETGTLNGDGINWLDLNIYGTVLLDESWTLIPTVGYSNAQNGSAAVDSGTDLHVAVAARYTF